MSNEFPKAEPDPEKQYNFDEPALIDGMAHIAVQQNKHNVATLVLSVHSSTKEIGVFLNCNKKDTDGVLRDTGLKPLGILDAKAKCLKLHQGVLEDIETFNSGKAMFVSAIMRVGTGLSNSFNEHLKTSSDRVIAALNEDPITSLLENKNQVQEKLRGLQKSGNVSKDKIDPIIQYMDKLAQEKRWPKLSAITNKFKKIFGVSTSEEQLKKLITKASAEVQAVTNAGIASIYTAKLTGLPKQQVSKSKSSKSR